MIVKVKLRFEDSAEAEEASGRTGQPLPKSMDVHLPGYSMNVPLTEAWGEDIVYEKVAEMLTYLGMGGLEFELVD